MAPATPPPDEGLFEHAACGLLVCAATGAVVRANAVMRRWLDYDEGGLVGEKRLQDLLTIGGKLFYQTHCGPLLSIQGSVAEVQLDMQTRTGGRIPVLINIVRRQHAGGVFDECAVFITNDRRSYERELLRERENAEAALDALRGAEARLREANQQLSLAHRRKDEFLATLAHELRNPLAPMRNVLEVVRLGQREGGREGWMLDVLDRQMTQLTHLVDDLMDASRITQGKLQLRRQPCDLIPIVRAAVDDIAAMARAAGHALELDLPPGPVMADADATRMTQVVANLLTNAVKYTPDGGTIALSLRRDDEGHACIAIRDSGIGIAPEALASVFEMFAQLTPALERAQGGLGIGLALVRGLVELHGGRLSVHSDGAGRGSTFSVSLPLLAAEPKPADEAAAPKLADEAAAPQGGTRILVVDDNVDAADTLAMALELLGHEVRTAHTAAAALDLAAACRPALILLDIGLPDMNGYEVARRIRASDWGVDVMLVAATGWGQEADIDRARGAGFDRHMVKPIEFERLRELLADIGPL